MFGLLIQNRMSKPLTKAEEQVMQVLWKLESAYLKDIIDEMPKPQSLITIQLLQSLKY